MTAKAFQASLQSDSTEVQDPFFLYTYEAFAYEDKSPTQRTFISKGNESLFSPHPGLVAVTDSSSPITFLMNCNKWITSFYSEPKFCQSLQAKVFTKFFRINYYCLGKKKMRNCTSSLLDFLQK